MIAEAERDRRGEPVILTRGGREIEGTIEWGGVTEPVSIYCEGGGRVVDVKLSEIRPDRGGDRPSWERISGERCKSECGWVGCPSPTVLRLNGRALCEEHARKRPVLGGGDR